ncbi:hypothetical protein [Prochlorococcus marinus]|uniref:hypothetical protein n=1 Tax=Prochlorococcus TaxID=1218 RepID=UPI0007B3DFD6|nr:hypothetical protein [Prochlorococcus marinus]
MRAGSAAEALPPAHPNSIEYLDKNTAIREAEVLRIEASLAAKPHRQQNLINRQQPSSKTTTGVRSARPESSSNRN